MLLVEAANSYKELYENIQVNPLLISKPQCLKNRFSNTLFFLAVCGCKDREKTRPLFFHLQRKRAVDDFQKDKTAEKLETSTLECKYFFKTIILKDTQDFLQIVDGLDFMIGGQDACQVSVARFRFTQLTCWMAFLLQ